MKQQFTFYLEEKGDPSVGIGLVSEEITITLLNGGWDESDLVPLLKEAIKNIFDNGMGFQIRDEKEQAEHLKTLEAIFEHENKQGE